MGDCFEHRAAFRKTFAAMAFGLALLTGCAMPGWPWGSSPHKIPPSSDAKSPPAAAPKSSGSPASGQTVDQAMKELEDVAALDPPAREKLLADLKQVDPSLQPLFLQTFLAEAAYKRREEQREREGKKQESVAAETPAAKAPVERAAVRTAAAELPETRFELNSSAAAAPSNQALPNRSPATNGPAIASFAAGPGEAVITNIEVSEALAPEPPVSGGIDSHLANSSAKPCDAATAGPPPAAVVLAGTHGEPSSGAVTLTGFSRPVPSGTATTAKLADADWQNHLAEAIRSIEFESKTGTKHESDIGLQARLRMLYLLAGRRDDAMRPLPAAPQATQDYWSSQIYGLSTWMDAEKTPDMGRRAAETKRILSEALAQLGETAPLAVHNLTFCSEVFRFGAFDSVKSLEFKPGQKVLLYAEIENLHVESSSKGYHWAVKVSGQIFDSRGSRITDYGSTSAEEYFQTPRRDFFVSKLYYLPSLVPGRYSLQLSIEDTLGHKVGQSAIDFTVKL